MNFQAVSVGQKLIETGGRQGGYSDATGYTESAVAERDRVCRPRDR